MLAHSQDFKEAITRFGRDIKVRIGRCRGSVNIKTEDDKLLLTEDNMQLLSDVKFLQPVVYYTEDDIISITKNNLGELFRTYMKSFDIKTELDFDIGEGLKIEIGTTVNEEPEYLNYGWFYVYKKTYNKAEKCYEYTVCDEMIKTMIPYKSEYVNWTYGSTVLIIMLEDLLENCGIDRSRIYTITLPNQFLPVYKKWFEGIDLTCRDVLDMILQIMGASLKVKNASPGAAYDEIFIPVPYADVVVDTINEDILKDSKVDFKEKFGPINTVVTTRSGGIDSVEATDDTSIETNGKCEYVIKDNIIADKSKYRDIIVDSLLFGEEISTGENETTRVNGINGLEYYENDIDTVGLGYIEYLDNYNVEVDGQTYKCKCLKNVATIDGGMVEEYQGEPPRERIETYENVGTDDKTASITVDKIKGEIVLKAYQTIESGQQKTKLAQVRLDANANDSTGSLVEISGDQIKLDGATSINKHFKIGLDGFMYADAGGNIAGWEITDDALYKEVQIGNNLYKAYIQSPLDAYSDDTWIFSTQKSTDGGSNYDGTFVVTLGGTVYCEQLYFNSDSRKALRTSNVGHFDAMGTQYVEIYLDDYATAYGINIWQSDKRIKHNIKDTKVNALDIINKIPHKEFIYNNDKNEEVIKIGYVADDLQEIDEQMVFEVGEDKIKQPNEKYIIPLLSKAIQEQQKQIDELKKELEELKNGRN